MNKFLILGLSTIIIIGGGYLLLTNQAGKPETAPLEEEMTSNPTTNPGLQEETEEAMVSLTESGFAPRALTIKAGTIVVFTNNTTRIATVDSDFHPTHRLYPFLNKGNFGPGEKHEVTFEEAGTYTYHNHINSAQTGTVIVE